MRCSGPKTIVTANTAALIPAAAVNVKLELAIGERQPLPCMLLANFLAGH